MTATTMTGKAAGSPLEPRGTGRPNKILMRDYANGEGWLFRVETDVHLDEEDFNELRPLLAQPPIPETSQRIVRLLHAKVEKESSGWKDKDDAKKMFSAGFGLLP